MPRLKKDIKESLKKKDFESVVRRAVNDKKVFRILISLSYDKEDLLCWRAIEAMGKAAGAVAERDPSAVRNVVQRLIWSMSEESGAIGWSAPEMLGEIVRNSPRAFADIPSIILSFREEEMFLKGILWAIVRIAGIVETPLRGADELALECLGHEDAGVRGLALMALSQMRIGRARDSIEAMGSDAARFRTYEDGELREREVREMAAIALGVIGDEGV